MPKEPFGSPAFLTRSCNTMGRGCLNSYTSVYHCGVMNATPKMWIPSELLGRNSPSPSLSPTTYGLLQGQRNLLQLLPQLRLVPGARDTAQALTLAVVPTPHPQPLEDPRILHIGKEGRSRGIRTSAGRGGGWGPRGPSHSRAIPSHQTHGCHSRWAEEGSGQLGPLRLGPPAR